MPPPPLARSAITIRAQTLASALGVAGFSLTAKNDVLGTYSALAVHGDEVTFFLFGDKGERLKGARVVGAGFAGDAPKFIFHSAPEIDPPPGVLLGLEGAADAADGPSPHPRAHGARKTGLYRPLPKGGPGISV